MALVNHDSSPRYRRASFRCRDSGRGPSLHAPGDLELSFSWGAHTTIAGHPTHIFLGTGHYVLLSKLTGRHCTFRHNCCKERAAVEIQPLKSFGLRNYKAINFKCPGAITPAKKPSLRSLLGRRFAGASLRWHQLHGVKAAKLVWATHFAPAADLFNQSAPSTAWKSKPT